ncbi:MAG: 50S ribosomal protein P1 [Candidatus Bathyarchaeota archaeon]|jgi:large subunit ribosomal protein L12|nr:50S ribosomal protein P1 [Candidatus Bathyarchaeum tardum]WGM89290.1 MAG: 50S ribosomal protein P1 [Candidatus Bathyarchaeum tardum]WNZ28427.1 MAG: 50S ribosomal protein P1 [Candidatus Bathyarchaeota archaeon]
MEYVYAAMLLHKAGKEITEQSVSEVLTAAGVSADSARVKALVASVAEVDIEEAIKAAPAMMAAAPAAPTAAAPAEEKKEEEPEEDESKKEEAAMEGLGSLFG